MSSNNRDQIASNHVSFGKNAIVNHVESSPGTDGVKSHLLSNGIIPERVVNSHMRNFGCRKSSTFADPNMVKAREERTSGNSSFSVSRLLGNENYRDAKLNSASSSYRISSILREDKSVSETPCGDSGSEKPPQLLAARPPERDHDTRMRSLGAQQHPLQLPSSSLFPFLHPYPHSMEERDKLGSGPERQYLDLSVAANRLLGGYSPYKFGVPFPTFPSFYMPPFHPLLAGNGLSSNLALVNSQNYLSSFVDSAKRIRDLNGMDPASLTTISTATRTGVSFPIDTLITVAPYTQTCVTGHYQNWL